ncbi:MAG: hypothetical protein IKP00_16090, partial [Victivallales bacterium]|nr:hypothetical protein [Victivallales bacterium]
GSAFDLGGSAFDLGGSAFDLGGSAFDLGGSAFDLGGLAFDLGCLCLDFKSVIGEDNGNSVLSKLIDSPVISVVILGRPRPVRSLMCNCRKMVESSGLTGTETPTNVN